MLALSATPIPRTLHMSLAGLRDISVIETPPRGPPADPHATSASTTRSSSSSALERELAREGQAFYLHNRVETIDEAAEKRARSSVPSARVLVAHGQMRERELEDRMLAFLAGDADVLVSTTIIESGLDIPQANTLIVERADMLGLAQLYQIRGRVGRRDVPAHAYLFYPDATELTPEARARLATLADHTELGAGFAIAMRDLEIRGAGDLLGAEQSGHVAAVGFELYVEMLDEAVAELSGAAARSARGRCASTPASTPTCRPPTSPPRRSRSTCTGGSRSPRTRTSCASSRRRPRTASARCPEPVENLFAIQEAKLKLARLGADYLVFRGGRATVGPLVLGSERAARAARPDRHRRLHVGEARGDASTRGVRGGARAGRCYAGRAPGGLSRRFS